MIDINELKTFDITEHLQDDESIAMYLSLTLEEESEEELAVALGHIARAKGMTEVAKKSGITREALYKALRTNSKPRFDTINRVCHALGVRLVAQPIR